MKPFGLQTTVATFLTQALRRLVRFEKAEGGGLLL